MIKKDELEQFIGDIERYKTLHPRVITTPGIQYLCDHGAAWLVDAVVSHYLANPDFIAAMKNDARLEAMAVWRLEVNDDMSAILTARADSDEPEVVTQEIPVTDFPLDEIIIWSVFDGEYWTLMLPSEY